MTSWYDEADAAAGITVTIDVDEVPPASKGQAESARTMFAGLGGLGSIPPPTEPLFRGDAREAVDGLLKQAKRVEDAFAAGDSLAAAVNAMQGVRQLVERLLGPRTHYLKADSEPFALVRDGSKLYEVRRFDRDYRVGDFLVLAEFDRQTGKYSGEKIRVRVTTITSPGRYGLPHDVGVLGISFAVEP